MRGFFIVQAERLELSHLAALDPKSSVSTNSTTPANCPNYYRDANINITFNNQIRAIQISSSFCTFKVFKKIKQWKISNPI